MQVHGWVRGSGVLEPRAEPAPRRGVEIAPGATCASKELGVTVLWKEGLAMG